MAIVKPEAMSFKQKNIIMIISGLPGVGKTTVALSAPDTLLIDTDDGIARVNPIHRRDTSICKTFAEIKADVAAAKGQYKTIVIDTGGALVEMMKQHVIDNPKDYPGGAKKAGGLTIQGYGYVKQMFLDFSADLRKNFNVVFIFHENKTRNDDDGVFYELICEGQAKTLVYEPADLAAHMFIQNGQRMLGFTPTEQYSAKSAYGISGIMPVDDLSGGRPNDFLTRLFDTVRNNLEAEVATLGPQQKKYEEAMHCAKEYISYLDSIEKIPEVMELIGNIDHALTSKKECKAMFNNRLKELGIVYDKEAKAYVYAEGK